MEIEARIFEFVSQDLLQGKIAISRETPLFSSRLLDSLSLMELVAFIDEDFGVNLTPSEVRIENFDTVEYIARMIGSKMPGSKG